MKSRKQLPHLFYPKVDDMRVIDKHRFDVGVPALPARLLSLQGPSGTADQSGNGHDIVYLNGFGVTSSDGRDAFGLDGINDYAITSSNFPKLDYTAGGTFGAWINPDTIAGGDTFSSTNPRVILCNAGDVNFANGILRLLGGRLDFLFRNAAGTDYAIARSDAEIVTTGAWQLVTAVHTGSAMLLYYNGSLVASTTINYADEAQTLASKLLVGREPTNRRYYSGLMDDMSVWASPLSASDIANWYAGGRGHT